MKDRKALLPSFLVVTICGQVTLSNCIPTTSRVVPQTDSQCDYAVCSYFSMASAIRLPISSSPQKLKQPATCFPLTGMEILFFLQLLQRLPDTLLQYHGFAPAAVFETFSIIAWQAGYGGGSATGYVIIFVATSLQAVRPYSHMHLPTRSLLRWSHRRW